MHASMLAADIQVRLLLSIDRRQSTEEALDTARLAVSLRDEGVAGLDLSGNPMVGQVRLCVLCSLHDLGCSGLQGFASARSSHVCRHGLAK